MKRWAAFGVFAWLLGYWTGRDAERRRREPDLPTFVWSGVDWYEVERNDAGEWVRK